MRWGAAAPCCFLVQLSAGLLAGITQGVMVLDTAMNDPWKPQEIWVPIVYFIVLRPVLWYVAGRREADDHVECDA